MDLREQNNAAYRHPWELARKDALLRELDNLGVSGEVLDIGCGDGYFDRELLKQFSSITNLWGVDIHADESIHKGKLHYVNTYKDIGRQKFDYILMMDVLEHIKDDVGFLVSLRKYLKPDTILVVTVPAFQRLYSLHDRELKHFRRYQYKSLKKVLEQGGFKITDWSYFYFSLILLRCLTFHSTQNLGMWNRSETDFVTLLVRACLNLDYQALRFLARHHIHVGGLSLLAICKGQ